MGAVVHIVFDIYILKKYMTSFYQHILHRNTCSISVWKGKEVDVSQITVSKTRFLGFALTIKYVVLIPCFSENNMLRVYCQIIICVN